jgi:hypothetical protein
MSESKYERVLICYWNKTGDRAGDRPGGLNPLDALHSGRRMFVTLDKFWTFWTQAKIVLKLERDFWYKVQNSKISNRESFFNYIFAPEVSV